MIASYAQRSALRATGDKNGRSGPEGAFWATDVQMIQLPNWEGARLTLSAGYSPARTHKALF